MALVLVTEGVFSPYSSSVHIWRILTGRVSIKEGSTMKKIAGAKGQVGGGQQGERGRNGSRTPRLVVRLFGGDVCVECVYVCVYIRARPKCGREVCQVTLFQPPPNSPFLSRVCSFSSPSGSPQHLFLPREPLYRGSACILGKDFTVRGHRLLLSNKQSGTSGCPRTPAPRLPLPPLS